LRHLLLALAAIALIGGASQATAAEPDGLFGVWRNPKNSVHVDIRPCGASACGYVVWATDKARRAAQKGSGNELVGMQLFREFARRDDEWRGRVYVPDLDRQFSGSVRILDTSHLEAKGCALGRFLCKTQTWTRVS